MERLQTLKTKGQERVAAMAESGQEHSRAKTWGVTAAAGAAGAVGLAALGGLLASTPLALTLGALGGGALGWKYMHGREAADAGERAAQTAMEPKEVAIETPDARAESAEDAPPLAEGNA